MNKILCSIRQRLTDGLWPDPKAHWNRVYRAQALEEVSWYQARPEMSLRLVTASGVAKSQAIIDVGGGASRLVDCLLEAGFDRLTVLDVSGAALECAKQRLGPRAEAVEWIEADVTRFAPPRQFDLWHDRAVFHFLTRRAERERYAQTLSRALAPAGQAIIATFATDGPRKCSGLRTMRYDAPTIGAELGPALQLVQQANETHRTPRGTRQSFAYFRFSKPVATAG